MNKKKNLVFFLALILLINCSFDDKTGIWSDEKKRIVKLEESQKSGQPTDLVARRMAWERINS